jgi:hypothetical protein
MRSVDRVVRRTRWWLGVRSFLHGAAACLAAAAGAALVARVGERLAGMQIDWVGAALVGGAVAIIGGVVWAVATRGDRAHAARLLDEGAGLRQAVGTAVTVAGSDDPWARAAAEHAEEVSRGVRVSRAIPIGPRRWWWAAPALVAVVLGLGLVPRMNLLERDAKKTIKQADPVSIQQAKEQVKAVEARVQEALAKVAEPDKQPDDAASEAPEQAPKSPEEVRRDAVKRLTSTQERLKALEQSPEKQSMDALQQKLQQLRSPGEGPLSGLADALQKGDFSKAKQELEELKKKLDDGTLSAEQKEAASKQLENLAEQLKKLSEQKGDLEKKLSELGLDKALAGDPEALKKALEQMKNLTPEQKQALEKMAKQMAQASESAQKMGEACKQCAGGMKSGDGKSMAGAMGGLGEQLSALEMAQQDMAGMRAAQREVEMALSQLSQQMMQGECMNPGLGTKPGAGRGRGPGGGDMDVAEAGFKSEEVKARSKNQPGPVIGSMPIPGQALTGEARQELAQTVAAADGAAAEAMETMEVPREFHEAIKHYFGRLKSHTEGTAPDAGAKDVKPSEAKPKDEKPAEAKK